MQQGYSRQHHQTGAFSAVAIFCEVLIKISEIVISHFQKIFFLLVLFGGST